MIKYIFNLFLFMHLILASLMAGGTNAFNFLQMSIGSRAQGMGNAFTAIGSDINTIYYNPAGIGFASRPTLMFFHAQLYEDIAVENFSALYPNFNNFSFSFGLSYLHLPAIEKYDINALTGEPIPSGQTFQFYDFVPQIGLSYRATSDLSLGLQIKYLQERIDNVTASGLAFDVGALYKVPVEFLSVGFALQNLGPRIKYENTEENIPLTYRLGMAYQIPDYMVTIAFDAVKTVNEEWRYYPGLEVEFLNSIAVRAGYQFNQDLGAGYNVGLGFTLLDSYRLNYVFSPYGILGSTHKAEITISIGDLFPERSYPEPRYKVDYSRYYELGTGNVQSRNISYFIPVPTGLKSRVMGDELILSWNSMKFPDARYNIYIEMPDKADLIKVNESPVTENSYSFHPNAPELKLTFYISLVKDNRESELSEPLLVKYRK